MGDLPAQGSPLCATGEIRDYRGVTEIEVKDKAQLTHLTARGVMLPRMDSRSIVATIDAEISALERARVALIGIEQSKPARKKRRKRRLSPEGRARIVAAVKKRWAAKKK